MLWTVGKTDRGWSTVYVPCRIVARPGMERGSRNVITYELVLIYNRELWLGKVD